jgi:hypothetical protein
LLLSVALKKKTRQALGPGGACSVGRAHGWHVALCFFCGLICGRFFVYFTTSKVKDNSAGGSDDKAEKWQQFGLSVQKFGCTS